MCNLFSIYITLFRFPLSLFLITVLNSEIEQLCSIVYLPKLEAKTHYFATSTVLYFYLKIINNTCSNEIQSNNQRTNTRYNHCIQQ